MSNKKQNNKNGLRRKLFFPLFIGIGVIILFLLYFNDFIPKNNTPTEVSEKPIEYKFDTPQKMNVSPKEIDSTNITPISLNNTEVGIPELGIKLRLSEGIKDLVYYKSSSKAVFFSTAKLTNMGKYCVASQAPLGSFFIVYKSEVSEVHQDTDNWRYQKEALEKYSQEWVDQSGTRMPPMVKAFDSFYIVFEAPQATCSDTDNNKYINELQSAQVKLLRGTISSIALLK